MGHSALHANGMTIGAPGVLGGKQAQPVRLQWHPNYGPCPPVQQMVADLQLLRDLGCNFVRGTHYPQDQRFLVLCDEFGVLVWGSITRKTGRIPGRALGPFRWTTRPSSSDDAGEGSRLLRRKRRFD